MPGGWISRVRAVRLIRQPGTVPAMRANWCLSTLAAFLANVSTNLQCDRLCDRCKRAVARCSALQRRLGLTKGNCCGIRGPVQRTPCTGPTLGSDYRGNVTDCESTTRGEALGHDEQCGECGQACSRGQCERRCSPAVNAKGPKIQGASAWAMRAGTLRIPCRCP